MSAWLCRFGYFILVISVWYVGPRVVGLAYLIWCGRAAMVTLGLPLRVISYRSAAISGFFVPVA